MVLFFKAPHSVIAVHSETSQNQDAIHRLQWLFGGADYTGAEQLKGMFIGPRKEMVTPWSTNAVEITQNMGIRDIIRIISPSIRK